MSFEAYHHVGTKTVCAPHCCKQSISHPQLLVSSKKDRYLTFNEHIADVYARRQMNFFEFLEEPNYQACLRILASSGDRERLNDGY